MQHRTSMRVTSKRRIMSRNCGAELPTWSPRKSDSKTNGERSEQRKQKELDDLAAQQKQEIVRAEKRLEQIARELSDRATRELESLGQESIRKFQKKLATAKAQADADVRRERQKTEQPEPTTTTPSAERQPIEPGSIVRVVSMNLTGSVSSIQGQEVEVLVGNIKLRRPESDLELIKKPIPLPKNVHVQMSSKELEKNEINLVGCRVDEALEITDKFLDDAFLAQMNEVRIVHGFGTGALRQAISELLSSHPHVARFEAAAQNQGGRGVTVVTLRD